MNTTNTPDNSSHKRKIYDTGCEGGFVQPPAKKIRMKRGALGELVNQPGDVLYEIFCHLDPPDLTNLSRTSKSLREQLLSRSATSIWKQSISNIPGLPECPNDISHPRYAELVFGKTCHFCGGHTRVFTYWSARIRACKACEKEECHPVSCGDRPYSAKLFELLPIAVPAHYARDCMTRTVFKAVDLALYEEFLQLEVSARGQWEANKIMAWEAIHAHAERCRDWAYDLHDHRRNEKRKVFEGRRELVIERVKALGWGDELALISDERRRPENLPFVRKACNRILTEQALSNLEAPIIQCMLQAQKHRLSAIRWTTLPHRLRVLKAFHTARFASVPVNFIYPTAGEFFRIPVIRDLIDSVPNGTLFTQDNLRAVAIPPHHLAQLIQWWYEDMELKLINLLYGESSHRVNATRANIFNLATSIFFCSICSRFLRYPHVLAHACATLPFHQDYDLDATILTSTLGETFWNLNGCITRNANSVSLLASLLLTARFDWQTTTIQELNARNPIFECISCNDQRMGRATMTWERVLIHCLNPEEPHKRVADFHPNLVMLGESEAQIIRARMREQMGRDLYNGSPQTQMVCLVCGQVGDFVDLQNHVRTTHGGSQLVDISLYGVDVDRTPPLYRHWPPRA